MDCPLTNQGRYRYTFTFRIGAKRAKDPANQISVNHSLDQSHEHQPKCLLEPGLTPGQIRAKGVQYIPAGLLVEAQSARGAGFNTADVNKLLKGKAAQLGLDITWNWHHLDHKLSTVFGNVRSDARGLTDWLGERQHKHGLMTEYTTDLEGCLERAFFAEKGAKEHYWAHGVL